MFLEQRITSKTWMKDKEIFFYHILHWNIFQNKEVPKRILTISHYKDSRGQRSSIQSPKWLRAAPKVFHPLLPDFEPVAGDTSKIN